MTRENKLALIIGFALVLVVGILVSDHFSEASTQQSANLLTPENLEQQEGQSDLITPVHVDSQADGGIRLLPQTPAMNGSHMGGSPQYLDNPDLQAARAEEQRAAEVPQSEGYRWYTVQAGESLSKICQREYGDMNLYPQLAAFNPDRINDPDHVPAGTTIRIPTRTTLGATTPARSEPDDSTPADAGEQQPESAATQYILYTIKSGDNLTEIAQKFLGTSRRYMEIFNLNKDVIPSPDTVIEGRQIRIPKE